MKHFIPSILFVTAFLIIASYIPKYEPKEVYCNTYGCMHEDH